MNDELPDPRLDACLRAVPLPEDLLARLRVAAGPADEELDAALVDVPVPAGFSQRLHAAVEDQMIEDILVTVDVPPNLLARLRIIPEVGSAPAWRRLALAACLMVVVGSLYGLGLYSILGAVRPAEAIAASLAPLDLGPLRLQTEEAFVPIVHLPPTRQLPVAPSPPAAPHDEIEVTFVAFEQRPTPGAAGELLALLAAGMRPSDDTILMRWRALGAPQRAEPSLPDLVSVAAPRAPGPPLPPVRGYDRAFRLRHDQHPPVSPAANATLATSHVPLTGRSDSVDLTRRQLVAGRLPDEEQVRVEDFLASLDYHFPVPAGNELTIHTAAGPALFASQPHHLLQVGIQGPRAARPNPATHLAIALDISTSMSRGQRLVMATQALAKLFRHVGPDDHVSLIVFHHDAVRLVENLERGQIGQLAAALAPLRASGGDNFAGGLQQAISTLLAAGLDDRVARSLVVLTDGQCSLPPQAEAGVRDLLRAADAEEIRTTVVQVGPPVGTELPTGKPLWETLGPCPGTTFRQAVDAREVRWRVVEALTGQPVAVADKPAIRVTFDPRTVKAYRLVGHGATQFRGQETPPESTALHDAEGATVLYELWLHPNRSEAQIARVEASWRDPRSGRRRTTPGTVVNRSQIVSSVAEMAPSLQAAAVAAELGGMLSGTHEFELSGPGGFEHRKKRRDFGSLATACEQLSPQLASWSEFQSMMKLVETLDRELGHPGPTRPRKLNRENR